MRARSRTCPTCGRHWTQPTARFCGGCGERLSDAAPPPPPGRSTAASAARVGLAVVTAGVVLGLAILSQAPPEVEQSPSAEVQDPGGAADPSPSEDDARPRTSADTTALRCEPQGCEAWRLDLDTGVQASHGVAAMDNGEVALLEQPDARRNVTVTALDPSNGSAAWSRSLPLDGTEQADRARLARIAEGVVVMAGPRVTALDQDGEVVWRWHLDDLDVAIGRVQHHVVSDDGVVLLQAIRRSGAAQPHTVLALDTSDGALLWRTSFRHSYVHPELLVVQDERGHLRRLDPTTGETRWHGPSYAEHLSLGSMGGWIVVTRAEHAGLELVHAGSGEVLSLPGTVFQQPRPAGRGVVTVSVAAADDAGTVRGDADASDGPVGSRGDSDTPDEPDGPDAPNDLDAADDLDALDDLPTEATEMYLHHLDDDGPLTWSAELEDLGPWQECCTIAVTETGMLSVSDGRRARVYSTTSGELLSEGIAEPAKPSQPSYTTELRPDLEATWADGGRRLTFNSEVGEAGRDRDDGELTVTSRHPIELVSEDPLIVGDRERLIRLRITSQQ